MRALCDGGSDVCSSGLPSSTTAGVAHDVTVTATDAYGNTDTNYVGSVSITSTDPQAVVPGSAHTFTTGVRAEKGGVGDAGRLETEGKRSKKTTDSQRRR